MSCVSVSSESVLVELVVAAVLVLTELVELTWPVLEVELRAAASTLSSSEAVEIAEIDM
jgi:hypothetical protein